MRLLTRLFAPKSVAHAHCDLPCGVYDPAQARIEAESVKAIIEKYQQNTDPEFRQRCIIIKEQRSELVKHHLWVLWTDYFKPPHFEKYPQLHTLFNEATKLAGATGTKGSADVAKADELLAMDAVEILHVADADLQEVIEVARDQMAVEHEFQFRGDLLEGRKALGR